MILAQAAPSSEPLWRMELNRKIEAYRVRTGRQPAPDPQPPLPFPSAAVAPEETPVSAPAPRPAERRGREPVHIYVVDQTGFNFPASAMPSPNHALVPVAGLRRRALAWAIDIGFLSACWVMFVGLLAGLGVELADNRIAMAICMVIFLLLYAQYFGLFTAFGGVTPGMRVAGLRVVSFDGNAPTPKQLLWRSFGYLVAGGAAFLGFLWALWDEDHLCWQDRTSQTYLTALAPVAEHKPAEAHR
ncbi:MAG TPA: RDD family protein [Candidatus Dormibacteraeota bacterium]|nr:RDD family protein [Candidatus Dormibacteraeota bacterium]